MCYRAAFEVISRTNIRQLSNLPPIDVRNIILPDGHPEDDAGYDPRKNRKPATPIKLRMAYFNLLRTIFGAGVLAMPLAISQAGMFLGPLLTIIIVIIIHHCHLMLLSCLNEVSRRLKMPHISYRYGFRLALLHGPKSLKLIGHFGPIIIATFMFLSQLGICCVYLVFIADSFRDTFDIESSRTVMIILYLPMIGLVFYMKNLKIIGYISMAGNVLMVLGMVLTFYIIFIDEPYNEWMYISDNIIQIMLAVGIILFNHSSIGVILSIDKALPDPYLLVKPLGILDIGIMIPAIVGAVFGALGYWKFGVMDENVLRSLPFEDNLSLTVFTLYNIAIMMSYPLQCFPGIEIMLEVYKNLSDDIIEVPPKWVDYVMRIIFVSISFLVMLCVPFQGPFVAFVGSMCTAQLALIFPAMMEVGLKYPGKYGKWNIYLIKDIALIILGSVVSFCGMIISGYIIYLRMLL